MEKITRSDGYTEPPSYAALRIKAIQSLLVEKGLVVPEALDEVVDIYENRIGPKDGASVIARAWTDPEFKAKLIENGTGTLAALGMTGFEGAHIIFVENTETVHNMVVCTLCSCYPWAVLGLPPAWYKAPQYRSRAVLEPRKVLQEFGTVVPAEREIRVWDSTAEIRYIVIPQRPPGTDALSIEQLTDLVNRDSMIGTRFATPYQGGCRMNGIHDVGGKHGFGPVTTEENEPVFHGQWEADVFSVIGLYFAAGLCPLDEFRHSIEVMDPAEYLSTPYYVHWLRAAENLAFWNELFTPEELQERIEEIEARDTEETV